MNSLAERKPLSAQLEAARTIVQTDDPVLLELAERLLQIDSYDLCDMKAAARNVIAKRTDELKRELREDIAIDVLTGKILLERIKASGGKAIAHDNFKVEITASKTIYKRIAVLRQLEGKVPEAELAPALFLSQPEPEWKADAAKLRAIQRKYGKESEIGKIIEEGLVDVFGEPKLVFEPLDGALKVAN